VTCGLYFGFAYNIFHNFVMSYRQFKDIALNCGSSCSAHIFFKFDLCLIYSPTFFKLSSDPVRDFSTVQGHEYMYSETVTHKVTIFLSLSFLLTNSSKN
jgi:hypothetical protein